MAGLAAATSIVATSASVVSATHSLFELNAKVPTFFGSPQNHLNKASICLELSVDRMEKFGYVLPYDDVHQWRITHDEYAPTPSTDRSFN
jgi:hypothetical protein